MLIEDIWVKDSLLIVRNNNEDSMFLIYSLPDFRLISTFGKKGRAPGELLIPLLIRTQDSCLRIFDFGMNQFCEISHLDSCKACMNYNYKLVDSPQKIISFKDSCLLMDHLDRANYELIKYENISRSIIYSFHDLKKRIKVPQGYCGFWDIHPQNGNIVFAYQYLHRFDIIGIDGSIKSINKYEDSQHPIIKNKHLDYRNSITYYWGVQTTEKNIFLYYIGKSGDEIGKNFKTTTYIEEYDWNGNPIKKYAIDRFLKFIEYYDGYFIGVDPTEESPFVIYKTKE